MKIHTGIRSTEQGAVMVFTAIVLVVLVGIAALAIDLTLAMAERRDAQNAADHAALSAAWAWCETNSVASAAQAAVDSAEANGYTATVGSNPPLTAGDLSLESPESGLFEAAIDSTSSTFFAKIWGSSEISIGTASAAECQKGGGSAKAIHAFGQCTGDSTKWGIQLSGHSNTITGGVHTDWTFTEGATPNWFNGQVTYGLYEKDAEQQSPDDHYVPDTPLLGGQDADPYDLDFDTYAGLATVTGNDITIGSMSLDGIYYSTGKIKVEGIGTAGDPARLTLIAKGSIEFQGKSYIEPHPDGRGVLAFSDFGADSYASDSNQDRCSKFGVHFDGNSSFVKGLVYSSTYGVEWNGNSNTLDPGAVVGWVVKFNGASNTIVADPSLLSGPAALDLVK